MGTATARMKHARPLVVRLMVVVGLWAAGAWMGHGPSLAQAQSTWLYSPYRIRVWLAMDGSPELTGQLADRIAATIADRSQTVAQAAWDIRTVPCPAPLHWDVAVRPQDVTVQQMVQVADRRLRIDDKLVLLSVRAEPGGFQIVARELDCHTRTWQPMVQRHTVQCGRIPDEAFTAVLEAFTPLMQIETTRGREVSLRIRAGGLIMDPIDPMDPPNPAAVQETDILLPVLRRNDRLGEPLQDGILPAPWTFLTIQQHEGYSLRAQAHSGQYSVLGMRASARVQKFALVASAWGDTTDLRLLSRTDPPRPLSGYEIYSKNPLTDETVLLGATDWRGILRVQRGDNPLQVLYVRNGGQLLARLPMVPGLEPLLTAEIRDDDRRLEAEGFVKGLQTAVMDLVARRQLIIARFRRHLQAGEFDQARALLEEFGKLPTRSDLARELLQQRPRFASSELRDRQEQSRIDKMFTDTQQLLTRFLEPGTAADLASELERARQSG
jgi:hypothetical protein